MKYILASGSWRLPGPPSLRFLGEQQGVWCRSLLFYTSDPEDMVPACLLLEPEATGRLRPPIVFPKATGRWLTEGSYRKVELPEGEAPRYRRRSRQAASLEQEYLMHVPGKEQPKCETETFPGR